MAIGNELERQLSKKEKTLSVVPFICSSFFRFF